MPKIKSVFTRLRRVIGRRSFEREMAEEMQFHVEAETERLIAHGESPATAHRRAKAMFGSIDARTEEVRDARLGANLTVLGRDLRFGVRSLMKAPAFTSIALLTLALGVGVNTSMFSILDALLFHRAPYPESDQLIRVFRTTPTMQDAPHSPANYVDLRDRTKSFSHLAAYARTSVNHAEPGQPAEQLQMLAVSGNFFAALGVSPELGRSLTPEDDQPDNDDVVVITHAFWQQRFAADPSILGQSIRLDGELIHIVGIMPAGFEDPMLWGSISGWKPLSFAADDLEARGSNWLSMLGRLSPEATVAMAHAEMNSHCAALALVHPATNSETGMNLIPFVRSTQDKMVRLLTLFAMGLATCVLLIACVNLANLFFARNVLRTREHAIRAALGASRIRLIWHSLAESLVLALGGGGLGLLIAAWVNAALSSHSFWGDQPSALAIDWRIAGFAFAAALLAAVIFGLLPAVLSSRTDVNGALKQSGRGTTSVAHARLRHGLIIAEVALALILLTGAGFFMRGLDRFVDRDVGWQTDDLLTARLSLPETKYPDNAAIQVFYDRLESRLAALPGVEGVSLSRTLPFYGFGWGQYYIVEGHPPLKAGTEPMRDVNLVTPDYFSTMGIAIVEGRPFQPADAEGPTPTIISASMAHSLWPGESAIGKRIAHPRQPDKWQEIVGIVQDVKFASNLDSSGERFQTYRPLASNPPRSFSIAMKCAVPPATLVESVRQIIAELDPELPVAEINPASRIVRNNTANFALIGKVLIGFALLGLTLAAIGLYGVVSGHVAQRTNEIGIRMALGAQWRDVLVLILSQGLQLTLVGTAIGSVGAWTVARILQSLLPALPPAEPIIAGAITGLLLATTLIACWLPARRATAVDPIVALRDE